MNKWKYTMDLSGFYKDDSISVEEKGRLVSATLKRLLNINWLSHVKYRIEELIEEFNCISGDGEPPETTEFTPVEDFDARMDDLYDFADRERIWVKTS